MPDYSDPWYTAKKALYCGSETRTWKGERFSEGVHGLAIETSGLSESEDCWAFWPDGFAAFALVDWHDLELLEP